MPKARYRNLALGYYALGRGHKASFTSPTAQVYIGGPLNLEYYATLADLLINNGGLVGNGDHYGTVLLGTGWFR